MSSTTPNIGLTKVASSETIGDLQNAMNGSGGNMDIIDTKMGPVGGTSLQAQVTALSSQKANADRVFRNSSYSASQTLQITLPVDIANGHAYLVVFRHYTSETTFTVDLMVLAGTGNNSVATAWIAKNSTATLQSTSVSGSTVTFTFSATAYASIYFIKMA